MAKVLERRPAEVAQSGLAEEIANNGRFTAAYPELELFIPQLVSTYLLHKGPEASLDLFEMHRHIFGDPETGIDPCRSCLPEFLARQEAQREFIR